MYSPKFRAFVAHSGGTMTPFGLYEQILLYSTLDIAAKYN